MSIFQPINLKWKGEEYEVAPDRVMQLIAKVEDVITLSEVYTYSQRGAAPVAKIAMAYGVALRYAGAKVRDDEVYQGLFAEGGEGAIPAALNALLSMMIPPPEQQAKPKKGQAAK